MKNRLPVYDLVPGLKTDGQDATSARDYDALAILKQTERLLADKLFCYSKRYCNLLQFLVEQTLDSSVGSLKERTIGIEVFGKRPDYDTSVDPTVRVAATEVRKRLSLYYQQPGHASELRINLPVRSYLVEFKVPDVAPPVVLPVLTETRRAGRYLPTAAVVLLVVAIGIGIKLLTPTPALRLFWAPFLNGSVRSVICVGTPLSGPETPENDVARTEFAEPGKSVLDLSRERTKPATVDAMVGVAVASFFGHHAQDSVLKIAPDTSFEDLRLGPLVILGAFDNSWAMRLGAQLPIRLSRASDSGIRWIADTTVTPNRRWAIDMSTPSRDLAMDYALVSRVYNPNTGQWWVGLAGLTGLGTLAASDLLTNSYALGQITSQLPKDWERKNLQMVFAIDVVNGSPASPKLVDLRSW